jgi:hypothetical protein
MASLNSKRPSPPAAQKRGRGVMAQKATPAALVRAAAAPTALGTLALTTPAAACPDCAIGKQARSEVWGRDFGFNLFVALLPFVIIGAICARAEGVGRPRARPRGLARAAGAPPPAGRAIEPGT